MVILYRCVLGSKFYVRTSHVRHSNHPVPSSKSQTLSSQYPLQNFHSPFLQKFLLRQLLAEGNHMRYTGRTYRRDFAYETQ
jgi:hypothetical protein